MIAAMVAQIAPATGAMAYPVARLLYTLLFMVFVLGTAMIVVRQVSRNRLFTQIVTTLGIFLMAIGTIVYTVSFRGLHLVEMTLGWIVSAGAIYWFLNRMHAIARAETESRLAAIKESETRFQAIIENAADVVSIVDPNGVLRYISPAVTRTLGCEPRQLQGKSFFEMMNPGDAPVARVLFREVSGQEGEVRSDEIRFRHQDGSWKSMHVTAKNLQHVRGVEAIVVHARDITVQKALETELRQSQRMETVGQLAGGVAHDFNNLLTVIRGRTDFLAEGQNLDASQREDVDEIRLAAERAASLTRQLLAFSRKQVLLPRVLDLNAVITNTERMLKRLIGEDILVQMVLDDGLGHINADSGQLEQVLLNLCLNARDAMPDGGVLRIKTANVRAAESGVQAKIEGQDLVMLCVSDTGEGMDDHTREHLFEPFFTTKPEGKGTGLGLSTVYGIIQQSGAAVTVHTAPGQGTTFRIYFPRTEAALSAPSTAPTRKEGSERLLLVEDDRAVRELAGRIFRDRGYQVTVTADAGEALRAFAAAPDEIDMVVTDLVMPGMNGRELVQALHQIRPGLKALFISGYTEDEIVRRGLHDAGIAFLHKPFTADVLVDNVRSLLDAKPVTA